MHRSIVGLIARREIRDLLRDRRTIMLILVLPALLYPLFGLAGIIFAQSMMEQTTRVGIVGAANLPKSGPALLADSNFSPDLLKDHSKSETDETPLNLAVILLEDHPQAALDTKAVDVVLIVPGGFAEALKAGSVPKLELLDRDGDEKSKLGLKRLKAILEVWRDKLREEKILRERLPANFNAIFGQKDRQSEEPPKKRVADEFRDTFVRVFPFILMMWIVAGAIQPAVDLTAGEKERGTMETLLISPASRSEIVTGKFLAVFAFNFASVIWNVLWISGAAFALEQILGFPILNPLGMIACLALGIPLAMFFSAISIALGVFARSTKEGQYYLMPLLLLTMPLALGSMLPGTELNFGNALIPVTGVMLLQQKFLSVSGDPLPWRMLIPVLGSLGACIAFALWLAVVQFRRESVLFREAGSAKRGMWKGLFARRS